MDNNGFAFRFVSAQSHPLLSRTQSKTNKVISQTHKTCQIRAWLSALPRSALIATRGRKTNFVYPKSLGSVSRALRRLGPSDFINLFKGHRTICLLEGKHQL